MSRVILFGVGRGANVAFRYLSADTEHEIHGFTVQRRYSDLTEFMGLPVVDFDDVQSIFPPQDYRMFVPLGFRMMNEIRYLRFRDAKEKGYDCISYVSSHTAGVAKPKVGENCFILDNQCIDFDVEIGDNVTIWSGNHIGDNTVIKDHCWLSSHVCINGDVTIEPFSFLGSNCTISNKVTVAKRSFVGANVLITSDTKEDGVYLQPSAKPESLDSVQFSRILDIG